MPACRLPNELYELLWVCLSTRDQYTCLLVCRSWYLAFRHLIYREVTIHRRSKFERFHHALQTSPSLAGHCVRMLTIEHGRVTQEEIDNVLHLCPHLETLKLPLLTQHANGSASVPQYHHRLRQLKIQACPASLRLVSSFCLTHLSLQYPGETDERLGTLLQILSHTPNLIFLSLSKLKRWITINYMESIHSLLPQLETLEFLDFNHSLAYQRLLEPAVTPCHLRTFRCRGGAIYQPAWLFYIAFKYPDLITLDLEANVDVHLLDRREVDIGDVDTNKEAVLMIARHCRKLQVARWINFAIDHQSIDYLPLSVRDLGLGHFDGLSSATFQSIARLRLTSLVLQGTATIDVDEMANVLGQCNDLRDLTIDCGYPYVGIRRRTHTASTMDIIDAVLSRCQNLESMHLRIAYNDRPNVIPHCRTKRHALTCLTLVENSLDKSLFDYLAQRCPNLGQLRLWQCCRKKSHDQIEFAIHMPQHTLSVDIQNFYEHSFKWSRRCKLFGLTRPEGTWWYYMHKCREVEVRMHLESCHYEIAKEVRTLDTQEVCTLDRLLRYEKIKPYPDWTTYKPNWEEYVTCGIVHIHCKAINSFTINKKRVI